MKTYKYEAIDSQNANSEGIVNCNTFEQAVEHVVLSGRVPIRIEELNQVSMIAYGRLNKLKSLKEKLENTNKPQEQKLNPVRIHINPNFTILFVISVVWVGALVWWLLNKS